MQFLHYLKRGVAVLALALVAALAPALPASAGECSGYLVCGRILNATSSALGVQHNLGGTVFSLPRGTRTDTNFGWDDADAFCVPAGQSRALYQWSGGERLYHGRKTAGSTRTCFKVTNNVGPASSNYWEVRA